MNRIRYLISSLFEQIAYMFMFLQFRYWEQNGRRSFDIMDTHTLEGTGVNSVHGYSPVTASHLKRKSKMLRIILEDGTATEVADEHLLFNQDGEPVLACSLVRGDEVMTQEGLREITSIEEKGSKFTFDLSVANQNNCYFTDGVLSHNSVMSAIYIVWYTLKEKDKTVAILSQNQDKVTDLMDKIKTVVKNLPFFMKPGIIKDDVMTLHFDNGCKIKAQTTTENSAAGITANLLYMDEFALIKNTFISKFFRTAYPSISADPNSRIIITSTARGMNKFYEIYNNAVLGKNYFNPLRVDWWEVPGRDEKWRDQEIANMGSEEDFNQEYGNQFIAGASLIFKSDSMQKLKKLRHHYVPHEMAFMESLDIEYDTYKEWIRWHPNFSMEDLGLSHKRWLITVDLAEGSGGDYTVFNIHEIMPMSKREIEKVKIFSSETDFYKAVQVGMFRTNRVEIPEAAQIFYHMVTEQFDPECVKVVLELNFDGKRFIDHVSGLYGEKNELDGDFVFVKFKHQLNAVIPKTGLKMTGPVKDDLCSVIKDKVKYNQLVPTEKVTIEESFNFSRNENGSYSAQSGNDDAFMTELLATAYFDTMDFSEMIEDMLEYAPEQFIADISEKLETNINIDNMDDEAYADLF